MTRHKQPVTQRHTLAWLHGGAAAIVAYSERVVDGARLPYTAEQWTRKQAREHLTDAGQLVTERKQLDRT